MPVLSGLFDKLRRHNIKVFATMISCRIRQFVWHCSAVSHNSDVKTAIAVGFSNCGTDDELSCSA